MKRRMFPRRNRLPEHVRAVAIIDSDSIDVHDSEAEPVITDRDADRFIDNRADDAYAKQPGLGAYLYDIDQIVTEETGEAWLRVLVGAFAGARLEDLYREHVAPRIAAYRLLAEVARSTGDLAEADRWAGKAAGQ